MQAAFKGVISLGVRRKGKAGKHGEVGVKRKCWVLVESPYSPQGTGRQLPRVEPGGETTRCGGEPGCRYHQRLGGQARARAHSRYIHVKQEQHERGSPDSPTIEFRLPLPTQVLSYH